MEDAIIEASERGVGCAGVRSEETRSVGACIVGISVELQAVIKPVLYWNPNLVVVANSFSQGLQRLLNSP